MADHITDIKDSLKEKKAVIGTIKTIKELKAGKLDRIYLTSNCPDSVKNEIAYYSSINNTKIIKMRIPNDELGLVCKKSFSISVLGVLK